MVHPPSHGDQNKSSGTVQDGFWVTFGKVCPIAKPPVVRSRALPTARCAEISLAQERCLWGIPPFAALGGEVRAVRRQVTRRW